MQDTAEKLENLWFNTSLTSGILQKVSYDFPINVIFGQYKIKLVLNDSQLFYIGFASMI